VTNEFEVNQHNDRNRVWEQKFSILAKNRQKQSRNSAVWPAVPNVESSDWKTQPQLADSLRDGTCRRVPSAEWKEHIIGYWLQKRRKFEKLENKRYSEYK